MSPAPSNRPGRPAPSLSAAPSRTRVTYELWRDVHGNYSFFPRGNGPARDAVGPQGELVWSVEAESWDEAVAAQRQYLGWGG